MSPEAVALRLVFAVVGAALLLATLARVCQ